MGSMPFCSPVAYTALPTAVLLNFQSVLCGAIVGIGEWATPIDLLPLLPYLY